MWKRDFKMSRLKSNQIAKIMLISLLVVMMPGKASWKTICPGDPGFTVDSGNYFQPGQSVIEVKNGTGQTLYLNWSVSDAHSQCSAAPALQRSISIKKGASLSLKLELGKLSFRGFWEGKNHAKLLMGHTLGAVEIKGNPPCIIPFDAHDKFPLKSGNDQASGQATVWFMDLQNMTRCGQYLVTTKDPSVHKALHTLTIKLLNPEKNPAHG
jgi:hypothetical protein